MTFNEALNKLANKYEKYGFDKKFLSDQLQKGIMNYEFSVRAAYCGMAMSLAAETGENEMFSIEDVMEVTGESREWVVSQIEQSREELITAGEDPDDFFRPVKSAQRSTFYFPHGVSDLSS